jgi:hypothetical protein
MLAEEIPVAFPPDQAIHVHDMGASSGITSMELFERLARERANIHVHASDFFDALYVVSPPRSHWQIVFNRALTPVQFIGRGIAVSAKSWPGEKSSRRLLCSWLRARELPRAFEILCAGLCGPGDADTDNAMRLINTISLFNPKCRSLALADARFTLGREDFMNPTSGPYHVIRLMNYRLSPVNPKLKSERESDIESLLVAIHRSLHPDGLFVLGSTQVNESQSGSTLFRRTADGFVTVRNLNRGTVARPQIEAFKTQTLA